MTPADKPEPVACPECGHLAGEESDLLTIAYMSGVYDERKARENGLRPTSDLAERIEGLVADDIRYLCRFADWAAGQGFCQIKGLDDPEEWLCDFWSRHGPPSGDGYSADAVADAILAALKEVNSHDRT